MNTGKISIIIPTYNEEENIERLLESIAIQDEVEGEGSCEVLVVDNGSTDSTVEKSQRLGAKVYQRPDDSIADLRNYGASHARGEILIFSDADNLFTPNVLQSVMNIFLHENCHAIGPDGLQPFEPASWMQRIWFFHTKILPEQGQSLPVNNLSSGFFAIRRSAFDEVGGFNGALTIGEDSDLSRRLRARGMVLLRTNRFVIYNSGHPVDILAFMKREFWHGDSISHLLCHKNIDSLTLYLFLHLLGIITLLGSLALWPKFHLTLSLIVLLGLAPGYKTFKRLGGFKKNFFSLYGVYFLYLCARSAALFKRQT